MEHEARHVLKQRTQGNRIYQSNDYQAPHFDTDLTFQIHCQSLIESTPLHSSDA